MGFVLIYLTDWRIGSKCEHKHVQPTEKPAHGFSAGQNMEPESELLKNQSR